METYVKVEVELGGSKKISTFNSLTINQRHDWHHTFELSLPLEDVEGSSSGFNTSKGLVGEQIKISINAVSAQETYNQFNGLITGVSISRHSGSGADVVIKGYSPTILLEDGENTRGFLDSSISNIVSTVTKGYPSSDLSVKSSPSPDTRFAYLVQYRESNFAFLTRLANETGKWFYYDGKDVHFGKLNAEKKIDLKLGNDLSSFDMGMQVKPVKFSDTSFDYLNNSAVKVPSSSIKVSGLDNVSNELLNTSEKVFRTESAAFPYFSVKNQSELKEFSTAKKSAAASNLTTINGVSYNPKLKIGSKIDISAEYDKSSSSYGSYIVTAVTHYTDSLGVYQSRFEAITANVTIPPPNPHASNPITETQSAVVTDNNDPDGHGRIKVKFHWNGDGVETPWIRVVNHHAGKNKGFQFLPEVNDEVLVAFEQNNPSRPYVLGALYNGKANHKDRGNKDNYVKTIRTVSGNEIKFYDEGGKEEIVIQNPDTQNHITLTLDDGGKITIKSKNKMELLAKEILIEAEKTLTMKSDKTTMEGKSSVDVASDQKYTLKAMDAKMEASNSLKMSANATAELKANTGLTLDGGVMTKVKSSATMELNGGGQATLKAGIVMIN